MADNILSIILLSIKNLFLIPTDSVSYFNLIRTDSVSYFSLIPKELNTLVVSFLDNKSLDNWINVFYKGMLSNDQWSILVKYYNLELYETLNDVIIKIYKLNPSILSFQTLYKYLNSNKSIFNIKDFNTRQLIDFIFLNPKEAYAEYEGDEDKYECEKIIFNSFIISKFKIYKNYLKTKSSTYYEDLFKFILSYSPSIKELNNLITCMCSVFSYGSSFAVLAYWVYGRSKFDLRFLIHLARPRGLDCPLLVFYILCKNKMDIINTTKDPSPVSMFEFLFKRVGNIVLDFIPDTLLLLYKTRLSESYHDRNL